jgi:hypothetical protein
MFPRIPQGRAEICGDHNPGRGAGCCTVPHCGYVRRWNGGVPQETQCRSAGPLHRRSEDLREGKIAIFARYCPFSDGNMGGYPNFVRRCSRYRARATRGRSPVARAAAGARDRREPESIPDLVGAGRGRLARASEGCSGSVADRPWPPWPRSEIRRPSAPSSGTHRPWDPPGVQGRTGSGG